MNTAGDAAEQTFRIVIEETEFVIRITGSLLKETIAMLYAISKDNKQNSVGKTNLSNMLKNCKDIRIFTVQKKDLDKFVEEAKNYGIYYCTLIDKADKSDNAIVDIMVRGDDAPRVNRIVERFDLEITDTATLRTKSIKENVKDTQMTDIIEKVQVNEEGIKDGVSNVFLHKEEVPSEPFLENKNEGIAPKDDRKSVREQLKELTNEMKQKTNEISKDKKTKKKSKVKKRGDKKNDKVK